MRAAIYGAGAMGTVLGAYIARAGYDIDLYNRNKDHVAGLRKNGAQIIGTTTFTQPVKAWLPEEMSGQYDVILLMTKQRYNTEIATFLQPFLAEEGILCTMQNGIPEPSVAEVVGADRTAGCTMSWGATFHGNGVSELTSEATRETLTFAIGKYGNNNDQKFAYIIELLNTMGDVKIEDNFIGARWAKLLINAAFSGLSVITAATFGRITDDKKARRLALRAIKECIDVARAADIVIEPIQGKDVVKLMDYRNNLKKRLSLFLIPIAMRKHKNIKSSMLRDIERGQPCEIDAINGIICAYGDKYNIDTPVNDRIVSIVKDIEAGSRTAEWRNLESMFDLLN